jgi:hypothetical protein
VRGCAASFDARQQLVALSRICGIIRQNRAKTSGRKQ